VPDEEEMHRQIPSFPVLLHIPTVPPILIEISISKPNDFGHDVEEEMEEHIETHDPSDCVWNRQSHQTVEGLGFVGLEFMLVGKPVMKFRFDVLHPKHQ
jgi:hypothetical protein